MLGNAPSEQPQSCYLQRDDVVSLLDPQFVNVRFRGGSATPPASADWRAHSERTIGRAGTVNLLWRKTVERLHRRVAWAQHDHLLRVTYTA